MIAKEEENLKESKERIHNRIIKIEIKKIEEEMKRWRIRKSIGKRLKRKKGKFQK